MHYQRGLSLQETLREETLGATILVTAVTELPLQLPLVQKYLLEQNIGAKSITTVPPLVCKGRDLCVNFTEAMEMVSSL